MQTRGIDTKGHNDKFNDKVKDELNDSGESWPVRPSFDARAPAGASALARRGLAYCACLLKLHAGVGGVEARELAAHGEATMPSTARGTAPVASSTRCVRVHSCASKPLMPQTPAGNRTGVCAGRCIDMRTLRGTSARTHVHARECMHVHTRGSVRREGLDVIGSCEAREPAHEAVSRLCVTARET